VFPHALLPRLHQPESGADRGTPDRGPQVRDAQLRPVAKYCPAVVGADGQSLPNSTWPSRANASSVGSAAGEDDSAVPK
jgi:hypothetical protein